MIRPDCRDTKSGIIVSRGTFGTDYEYQYTGKSNIVIKADLGSGLIKGVGPKFAMKLGIGKELLLLVLNRCHGDTPMDIIPERDFPEMNMESFSVYDCLEGRLCAEQTSFFSFYSETSDHPGTPCCRLLLVKSV